MMMKQYTWVAFTAALTVTTAAVGSEERSEDSFYIRPGSKMLQIDRLGRSVPPRVAEDPVVKYFRTLGELEEYKNMVCVREVEPKPHPRDTQKICMDILEGLELAIIELRNEKPKNTHLKKKCENFSDTLLKFKAELGTYEKNSSVGPALENIINLAKIFHCLWERS
jgi:hypothetical protein